MSTTATTRSPGAALAALAGAQSAVMLATSIVNVALPQIRAGVRQVGGAIGLAVPATLAGTATTHAAAHQPKPEALTAGYRTAFGVSAAGLAATAALALLLPAAPRPAPVSRI
uniref:MFS transporter n=1 Tax=Streptomyces sp. NBC_00049 TaxID=2903617 RepID=A0AAU2JZV5_9ACTN